MNSKNPLTDEICEMIAPWPVKDPRGYDCMRAAADWQLIQVLEFIDADPMLGGYVKDYIYKAMRP